MRKPRKLPKVCSSPLKKRGLCRGHDVALHELANMAGTKNWASSRGITYFRLEAEDRTTTVVAWTHQLHVQRCSLFSKRYSFQISSTAASSWKQQTLRCGQSVVLQCVLYFVLVCCSPVPGEPKPKVLWESRAPGVHVRGRSGLGQLSLCSETILFTKRLNPNFGFLSSPQLGDWDVFSSSFHSSGAGPKSPCPGPSRARARAAATPELGAESPNVVATPRAPGPPPARPRPLHLPPSQQGSAWPSGPAETYSNITTSLQRNVALPRAKRINSSAGKQHCCRGCHTWPRIHPRF